jgi:hypothetical protein
MRSDGYRTANGRPGVPVAALHARAWKLSNGGLAGLRRSRLCTVCSCVPARTAVVTVADRPRERSAAIVLVTRARRPLAPRWALAAKGVAPWVAPG